METTSPSWIGYKWYKFTEQPAFARAKLSEEEATFLQGRVETLHKMLADGVSWGTLHNSQQQPKQPFNGLAKNLGETSSKPRQVETRRRSGSRSVGRTKSSRPSTTRSWSRALAHAPNVDCPPACGPNHLGLSTTRSWSRALVTCSQRVLLQGV